MQNADPVYRLIDERISTLTEKIGDMKGDIIASVNKIEATQIGVETRISKINLSIEGKVSALERDLRDKTREVEIGLRHEIEKNEEKGERVFVQKHELYPIRLAVFGGIGALGLSIIGLFVRVISMQGHP